MPLVVTKKEERTPLSGGGILAMVLATALKRKRKNYQKDEGSSWVGSIAAMENALALRKHKNQAESPEGFSEEEIVTPSEIGISVMASAKATKNKENHYQKYDGGAPSAIISATTVAMVPENQNNKVELIIKTNKGRSASPYIYISAMASSLAVKKYKTFYEKYERIAPTGVTAMAAASAQTKYYSKTQSSVEINEG